MLPKLFKMKAREARFPDLQSELDAIAEGKKAMSVFFVPSEGKMSQEEKSLRMQCKNLGLVLIDHPVPMPYEPSQIKERYLFVLKSIETWRIQAYLATKNLLGGSKWSDGLEALDSYLLGYSEAEIDEWLKAKRQENVSWHGIKVYFLLNLTQWKRQSALGEKVLDPECYPEGIEIFYMKKDVVVDCKEYSNMNCCWIIARAFLDRRTFGTLFGSPKGWGADNFVKILIKKDDIPHINFGIQGKIECYRDNQWI